MQAYAAYLVELALPDYGMLKYSYSMLAAAAVFCAGRALGASPPWSHALQRHTGFSEALVRSRPPPCHVCVGVSKPQRRPACSRALPRYAGLRLWGGHHTI